MSPAVSIISIHLPGERIISVPSNVKNREDWLKNHEIPSSKLERYFLRPDLPEFNDMKICDYYGIYSFTNMQFY